MFSVSHHVGVTGVDHGDANATDSNSAPVTGALRPFNNNMYMPRPVTMCWVPAILCSGTKSQRVIRVSPTNFIRP